MKRTTALRAGTGLAIGCALALGCARASTEAEEEHQGNRQGILVERRVTEEPKAIDPQDVARAKGAFRRIDLENTGRGPQSERDFCNTFSSGAFASQEALDIFINKLMSRPGPTGRRADLNAALEKGKIDFTREVLLLLQVGARSVELRVAFGEASLNENKELSLQIYIEESDRAMVQADGDYCFPVAVDTSRVNSVVLEVPGHEYFNHAVDLRAASLPAPVMRR